MPDPRVTVIIPVYNAERFLTETLESVRDQTYTDYECLVIDDGSSDKSRDIAERFARTHPTRFKILTHPGNTNHGVSATRNLGLRQARGSLISFLDADDVWRPEKLATQVAFMDRHPEIGLSYTQGAIHREGVGERFMPDADILGNPPPPEQRVVVFHVILVVVNYVFSTVMVRANAIRQAGGFSEDLPFQSEDRIMVAKVAALYRIGMVEEVLCEYRAHADSYTAEAIRDRLPPAIFYDQQVRIMEWLVRKGIHPEWAREIAYYILPVSAVRAASCSLSPRILGIVLRDFFRSLLFFPGIPFKMLARLAGFFAKPQSWRRLLELLGRTEVVRAVTGTRRPHGA